jgi:hypothetical protein
MDINKNKLADLRDYFLNGGSTEADDILAFLATEDESVMTGYIAALKTTYPDDFGPKKKKPAAAKAPEPEPDPVIEQRFFLKDAITGLVTELEISKEKPGKTTLVVKEPKELVNILLRGEITTIDLYQLNKLPDTAEHLGVPVAKLKQLAELAKA